MSKIKQVLRHHKDGVKKRRIARLLGLNRNTVGKYIERAEADTLSLEELLHLDDPVLERRLSSGKRAMPDPRFDILSKRLDYITGELERHKSKLTLHRLWQEYCSEEKEHYEYTQFCFHVNQHRKASSLSYVMSEGRTGGEELFVDFAGDKMEYVDMSTGEIMKAEVFVATLPASDYGFAMAVPSQKVEDFLHALGCCLRHIGGVPQVIVTDNLKSAVVKSDRYQPEVGKVMEDFCNHYGCRTVPCRAYKPKDKALVENMVKLVYRHVFAPLRHTMFHSLEEMNSAIRRHMAGFNGKRMAQHPCTREERFLATDKPALRELPQAPFEVMSYTELKVADNSHVYLGRDRHYYSVPYRLIGQRVRVVYTRSMVNVYHEGEKVASHGRDRSPGRYTTVDGHMPSYYKDYAQRSPQRYIDRAALILPSLAEVVSALFSQNPGVPPETFYKSCDGLIHLGKTTAPTLMEKACAVALRTGNCKYRFVLALVRSGCSGVEELEREPDLFSVSPHSNIRDKAYYVNALMADRKNEAHV